MARWPVGWPGMVAEKTENKSKLSATKFRLIQPYSGISHCLLYTVQDLNVPKVGLHCKHSKKKIIFISVII